MIRLLFLIQKEPKAVCFGGAVMNRRQKLLLNTATSLIKQLVVVVCGFILPRYMLSYYGSAVNGLVASLTQFLGFISLLEMGIGPVIQANLYGPLAKKDNEQISRIIVSSERFFRRIAYIFLAYIAALAVGFPWLIEADFGTGYTVSLLVIIAISTFAQYYFGATYQLLLNADQKAYVQTILQTVTVVFNTIFSIILMKFGASIHVVKLVTAAIFVLRPLGQAVYVKKHYSLDKKIILTEEPIKQKWSGFAQHIAAVISSNVAVVILTLFSTLSNVSVYSVYFAVVNGITTTIMTAAAGLESYFGNMLAKREKETLNKAFATIEWLIHLIVTIVFTVTCITIVPFIRVYTDGITDVNYILPLFGVMLTLAYAAQCLRVPYFRIIKAAGHFRETQNGAFIAVGLNIVISLGLVFKYGLSGIALGTLIAMLYHTIYFAWYLRKNILNRPFIYFWKHLAVDIAIGGIAALLSKGIVLSEVTYLAWFVYAMKVGILTVAVASVFSVLTNVSTVQAVIKKKKA